MLKVWGKALADLKQLTAAEAIVFIFGVSILCGDSCCALWR